MMAVLCTYTIHAHDQMSEFMGVIVRASSWQKAQGSLLQGREGRGPGHGALLLQLRQLGPHYLGAAFQALSPVLLRGLQ